MYELFKPPNFVGIEYRNNIIKIFKSSKLINIAGGLGDEAGEGEYVQGRRDMEAKEALPQGPPPENRGPPKKKGPPKMY